MQIGEDLSKKIPSKFKIANHEIEVKMCDHSNDNDFGTWDDVRNVITIYKKAKMDGEVVEFTQEQILNTFYHELIHCFQFYAGLECDEQIAQVFANFIREYQTTKKS